MRIILIILLLLLPCVTIAQAQEREYDAKQPIDITADKLVIKRIEGKAVFSGNVRLKQGGMTLTCENLWVFFTEGEKDSREKIGQEKSDRDISPFGEGGGQKISHIVADKRVSVTTDDTQITSNRAIYMSKEQYIEFIGDVAIHSEENVLEGQVARYDMKRREAVVKPAEGGDRIRAKLTP